MGNKVVNNFNAGELSPYLYGRSDFPKYNSGCISMENFIPLTYGGAIKRPATKFITNTKDGNNARLISFVVNFRNAYLLEFTHLNLRILQNDQLLQDSNGNILELTTPYTDNDLRDIDVVQSLDQMFIAHPNHPIQTLTRAEIINVGVERWTIEEFLYKLPPVVDTNTVTTDKMQFYYKPLGTASGDNQRRISWAYFEEESSQQFQLDRTDAGQFFQIDEPRLNEDTTNSSYDTTSSNEVYMNQSIFTSDVISQIYTTGTFPDATVNKKGWTYLNENDGSVISPWMNISYNSFDITTTQKRSIVYVDILKSTRPDITEVTGVDTDNWEVLAIVGDNRGYIGGSAASAFFIYRVRNISSKYLYQSKGCRN